MVPVFSISSPSLDDAIKESLAKLEKESKWAQIYYGKLLLEIGSVKVSDVSGINRLRTKFHEGPKLIVSTTWKKYFVEEVLTCFELTVGQSRRCSPVLLDDRSDYGVDRASIIKKNQKLFSEEVARLFLYLENPSEFEPLDTCNTLAFFIMLQETYNLILVVQAHFDALDLSEFDKAEVLRRSKLAADWLEMHKDYSADMIIF